MAQVSTYLNFKRETEEAFNFYKSVFGTEFVDGIQRMGDVPPQEGMEPLSEEDKQLVMHVSLPILGGHLLMGTDAPETKDRDLTMGNNIYISLDTDTRQQTDELFKSLAEGGTVETELQEMFWGDYYGALTDKFGVQWMFNCASKE